MREVSEFTWRNIFDTNHKTWRSMTHASLVAFDSGYPYFCWNGKIYYSHNIEDTGKLTRDVV